MSLQVGQELWFVHRERRSGAPFATKGTRVGRKWAQLDSHYKIDIVTLVADGGQYASPGRCWLNKEAWEAEAKRDETWWKLRRKVEYGWHAPPHLSIEQIEQMIATLTPA